MNAKFFFVALLCVGLAVANPLADTETDPKEGEEPVTDGQARCITDALRELEINLEGTGELGGDALETVQRLIAHRQRCEDMLASDPPTTLEERLRDACRLTWTAAVAYELNRLRGETVLVDGAITAVQECRA